jgi:hypothetical protein
MLAARQRGGLTYLNNKEAAAELEAEASQHRWEWQAGSST